MKNKRAFFKGWYFKNQNKENTIAFIPAIHADKTGQITSSVQIITDEGSYCAWFSGDDLKEDTEDFCVRIGNNVFSKNGLSVNLSLDNFSVKGELEFSGWTPLKSDIMGPFRFVPFMQCNHGVLSLNHRLIGNLTINGQFLSFTGGTGYTESDWGRSFPKSYLWTQLCWQGESYQNSIMLSVADIPFVGLEFTGCICSILFESKEYRLATYCGVKVLKCTSKEVVLKQNDSVLEVFLLQQTPHPLHAPSFGSMTRMIKESPAATVRYRFTVKNHVLFDVTSPRASFEVSDISEN